MNLKRTTGKTSLSAKEEAELLKAAQNVLDFIADETPCASSRKKCEKTKQSRTTVADLKETQKAQTAVQKDLEKKKMETGPGPLPSNSLGQKLMKKVQEQASAFKRASGLQETRKAQTTAAAEKNLEKIMDAGKSWGVPPLPAHSSPFQKINVVQTPPEEDENEDWSDWSDEESEEEIKEKAGEKLMVKVQVQPSTFNRASGLQETQKAQTKAAVEENLEKKTGAGKSWGVPPLPAHSSPFQKINVVQTPLDEDDNEDWSEEESEAESEAVQPSAFNQEIHQDSRDMVKTSGLQEALEQERRARNTLEDALKKSERAQAALQEDLKKERRVIVQQKETLEQERKEKDALAKTLKDEQAKNNSLCAEMELTKEKVKESEMEHRLREAKMEDQIAEKTDELKENRIIIEKLQMDLQENKTAISREQREGNLEIDTEIQSLHSEIQALQSVNEGKDSIISLLQEKVTRQASDLKDMAAKNCGLHSDYEAAVCQKQKDAEELNRVTQKNQQLTSENKRLHSEISSASEEQLMYKTLMMENADIRAKLQATEKNFDKLKSKHRCLTEQHDEIISRRNETIFENQQLQCMVDDLKTQREDKYAEVKVLKKRLLDQQEETLEKDTKLKSLHLNILDIQSVIGGKDSIISSLQEQVTLQASDLKDLTAKKRGLQRDYEAAVWQKQREAAELKRVTQENHRLISENKRLHSEMSASEENLTKLDRVESKYRSLYKRHEEMMLKKDDVISEKQHNIDKLQILVAELKQQHEGNRAEDRALKERLTNQQEGRKMPKKDAEIQSLHSNIQDLKRFIEAKNNTSSLQEQITQQASELKYMTAKHCGLQKDYEAAVCQQQKDAEELNRVTQESQRLTSENKRLHGEISASEERLTKFDRLKSKYRSLRERHEEMMLKKDEVISEKQCTIDKLQILVAELKQQHVGNRAEVRALKDRLTDQEKRTLKKDTEIKSLLSNIQDLNRVIEAKNNTVSSLLEQISQQASDFKDMRAKHCGLQKDHKAAVCQQQRDAEELNRVTQENQRLTSENERLHGEISASEEGLTKLDRLKSKYRSLRKRHEEMMLKKDKVISENQNNITELKAQTSQCKKRQAELEDALRLEKSRNTTLQQEADQTSSALEKAKTTSAKLTAELKETLIKQIETVKERNKLVQEVQSIRDAHHRIKQVQQPELNFQFKGNNDTELSLKLTPSSS